MYKDLFKLLDRIPYFTLEAVRQLIGDEALSPASINTALYRWVKQGRIIKLKKGVYMTRSFYERYRADENFSALVSAILIPQSYLSLEFVLQKHGILTDITYPVTAITFKQTRVFENTIGTYSYRNIKSALYTGFEITNYLGISIARASLAKALFDYLYLRPWQGRGSDDLADDLRLNISGIPLQDRHDFECFVDLSNSPKMKKVLQSFRRNAWQL